MLIKYKLLKLAIIIVSPIITISFLEGVIENRY
jgi:hypothetical protein